MGGVKKKSLASMEKSQDSQSTPQDQPASKTKKTKETKSAPQQQKKLTFLVPKMTDAEMLKAVAPLKAITVPTASRALGVNASVATQLLREMGGRNIIISAGGFSGHRVWAVPKTS